MKKKLLAAVLAVTMVASLAGCNAKTKVTLCEYKGIGLESISEEEFNNALDSMASTYFMEDREVSIAEMGDTCNIHYTGRLDGVAFDGGSNADVEAGHDLTLGSGEFIPGFEEGLVGAETGKVYFVDATFPEVYSNNPDLAGKTATFEVKVNKITRPVKLELTDALVSEKLGSSYGYTTVGQYYTEYRASLNRESYVEQLGEYLSENCTVENLPEDEVEKYKNDVYDYAMQMAGYYASMYGIDTATIISMMFGFSSEADLEAYCLEGAKQNITYLYIIKEIADKENITVSDSEYEARAGEYAAKYGYASAAAMEESAGKDDILETILMDLVVDFLIANAQIF